MRGGRRDGLAVGVRGDEAARAVGLGGGIGVGEDGEQGPDALDEARAGAAEPGAGVEGPDAAGAHGRQVAPGRLSLQVLRLGDDLRQGIAAGDHEDDVGAGGGDLGPGGAERGAAGGAEDVEAAGGRDLVGRPVAGDEGWVGPLEGEDARAGGTGRAVAQGADLIAQRRGERAGVGGAADGVADVVDRGEDAVEVERGEAEHAGAQLLLVHDAVDVALADGADIAEGLGDDEVGREAPQQGLVDVVNGAAGGEDSADIVVDLGGRATVGGDGGAREDGQAGGLGGEVALVGDADHVGAGAEGEDDFGGAGQERDDAHGSSGAAAPAQDSAAGSGR